MASHSSSSQPSHSEAPHPEVLHFDRGSFKQAQLFILYGGNPHDWAESGSEAGKLVRFLTAREVKEGGE